MNMDARGQYLKVLQERYFTAKSRKDKSSIIDLVIHCGSSTLGLYICSLNTVEISSGWWEAEAIMGKGQDPTFKALKEIRKRTPFCWKGVNSYNGPEFINYHLINYK